MHSTNLIVPCFNEANRLDWEAFRRLAREPGVSLTFVDDGSTDDTLTILHGLSSGQTNIAVLALPTNCGKGEAVRRGMRQALERGAEAVGYIDADLSTPPSECLRLLGELKDDRLQIILASRVATLGARIRRCPFRHYAGRVFATGASLVLQCAAYDTQCGAKVFRQSSSLAAALEPPFTSRWAFDVELLGRLMIGQPTVPAVPIDAIKEVALMEWTHMPDSKVRPLSMLRAAADLGYIAVALRRARRRLRAA